MRNQVTFDKMQFGINLGTSNTNSTYYETMNRRGCRGVHVVLLYTSQTSSKDPINSKLIVIEKRVQRDYFQDLN